MAGAFGAGLLAGEVGLQGKVEAVLREDAAATNERARAFRRSEEFAERLAAREPALQGEAIGAGADSWTDERRALAHGHLYRVTDDEVQAGGAFLSMVLAKSPEKVTERGRAVAMEWRRREGERKIEQLYREADALGVSAAGTLGAGTVRTTAAALTDDMDAREDWSAEGPREAWRDEVIAKLAAEIDGRRKPVVDESDPDFAEVAAVDGTLDMPVETPAGRMLRLAERLRFLMRLGRWVDGEAQPVTSDEEAAFLAEIASLLREGQTPCNCGDDDCSYATGLSTRVHKAASAAAEALRDA